MLKYPIYGGGGGNWSFALLYSLQ